MQFSEEDIFHFESDSNDGDEPVKPAAGVDQDSNPMLYTPSLSQLTTSDIDLLDQGTCKSFTLQLLKGINSLI